MRSHREARTGDADSTEGGLISDSLWPAVGDEGREKRGEQHLVFIKQGHMCRGIKMGGLPFVAPPRARGFSPKKGGGQVWERGSEKKGCFVSSCEGKWTDGGLARSARGRKVFPMVGAITGRKVWRGEVSFNSKIEAGRDIDSCTRRDPGTMRWKKSRTSTRGGDP